MTLGEDFHTLDLARHPQPIAAIGPTRTHVGVAHIAFQVASYDALREAYEMAGDGDRGLAVTRAGEPRPAWLFERWPAEG